ADGWFAIWLPLNASIGEMDEVGDRPARCVPVTTTSCRVVVDFSFAASLRPCAAVAWLDAAFPLSGDPGSCACAEHASSVAAASAARESTTLTPAWLGIFAPL